MSLAVEKLKCEYCKDPVGVENTAPVFGWRVVSDLSDTVQTAYRILVAGSPEGLKAGPLLWDSGEAASRESVQVAYEGAPLTSDTEYFWTVRIRDNHGRLSEYAQPAVFETGRFSPADWSARWIEPVQRPTYHEEINYFKSIAPQPQLDPETLELWPPHYIRKAFSCEKEVVSARAYVTAHGVYELYLDGEKVSDEELAPGFTAYQGFLQYQIYDVTAPLQKGGRHAVGLILADGWYAGRVGGPGDSAQYGDRLGALLELRIRYSDGTEQRVCSDGSFRSSHGPLSYSDIAIGEKYDARLELPGFSEWDYDDSAWLNVAVAEYDNSILSAEYEEPVRVCGEVAVKSVYISPKGETILDFGQVLVGRVRMTVRGAAPGCKIVLEHAEITDKEGNYLNNIQGRFKNQTDIYICRGGDEETYEPKFTFHGFRYVRLTGYPGSPEPERFTARVLRSDMELTGSFSCSSGALNRLQQNIVWSQIGNMLSIPTDCPQRERVGWTGDVQVFASTAVFNMGMEAFFRRWLKSTRIDQMEDGQIPDVIPYLPSCHICPDMRSFGVDTDSSAGWGDVVTILPWTMFLAYGDRRILEENYDMMRKWVDYIIHTAESENPEGIGDVDEARAERLRYLWNTHFHFGDWLAPSACIDPVTGEIDSMRSAFLTKELVPSCFFAYSTELIANISRELGKEREAAYYKQLCKKVRSAFAAEYVDENGLIDTPFQGVYVLALKMRMVPEALRGKTAARLAEMIHENGDRLDTGFPSVPHLLDVLCETGYEALAYDLLFQEECPSWLYEVKMGATTMWESWQAIAPDGTPKLSSYNHYAFGCVGDWMYRRIAGLTPVEPGYRKTLIAPLIDGRLSSAEGRLDTVYGELSCGWRLENGRLFLRVTVPANASAEIRAPRFTDPRVSVSSSPFGEGGSATVGSGSYSFEFTVSN